MSLLQLPALMLKCRTIAVSTSSMLFSTIHTYDRQFSKPISQCIASEQSSPAQPRSALGAIRPPSPKLLAAAHHSSTDQLKANA